MGGGGEGRSLEQTPSWAVATVCFMLVVVSIVIQQIIHRIGQWFIKKQKRSLYESLEKIKGELMLVGFISLLLAVGTSPVTKICISKKAASTWHPCNINQTSNTDEIESRRRLLAWGGSRRILGGSSGRDKCAEMGKVSFMSSHGVHQLHIFIFVLAVSHVLYCILTMAIGRLKMRSWKRWESETKTPEYQFSHDPDRIRFTRDTSFGRRHMSFWSESPVLLWIVCFFRQFFHSVPKVDYLTMRHGFIVAHLSPDSHSRFDFQKYIHRSLEEDFKVVLSISPPIWLFAVVFLLLNTHGLSSHLWLPFVPLIIVLLVGTKLQMIITKMGVKIKKRGENVVKGVPVVEPGDDLFWFNRPRLLLYILNFVLFQNAFQLAFFSWTAYQFGLKSCFHEHVEGIVIIITMGALIQILCSYVTLPLYALVTQMGSTMKPTIFNDRVATALRKWHHTAKKHIKENKKWGQETPISSRPGTPSSGHNLSPIHLLHHHWSNMYNSPARSNPNNNENWEVENSIYPMSGDMATGPNEIELSYMDEGMDQDQEVVCSNTDIENQHG